MNRCLKGTLARALIYAPCGRGMESMATTLGEAMPK